MYPDAFDIRLPAELSFGADFARNARDFRGERGELRNHRVDGLRGAQELAFEGTALELNGHRSREVALRDGADHARDLVGRLHQIADERVDRVTDDVPAAASARKLRALIELALFPNDVRNAFDLRGHSLLDVDEFVQRVGDLAGAAGELHWHARGEVAFLDCGERA